MPTVDKSILQIYEADEYESMPARVYFLKA